ncbi:hypothetical protein ACWEWG_02140, partial [Streptomyces sp. NPDC003758]
GGNYPAATTAQTSDAYAEPPAFFSNQADFYTIARLPAALRDREPLPARIEHAVRLLERATP